MVVAGQAGSAEGGGVGIQLEGVESVGGLVGDGLEKGTGSGKEIGEGVAEKGQTGGERSGPFGRGVVLLEALEVGVGGGRGRAQVSGVDGLAFLRVDLDRFGIIPTIPSNWSQSLRPFRAFEMAQ